MRCRLEAHWRRSELSPPCSAPHHCSPAPLSRSAPPSNPSYSAPPAAWPQFPWDAGVPDGEQHGALGASPPILVHLFLGGNTTLFQSPGNAIHDDTHSTEEHGVGRSTAKKSPSCPRSATPEQTARPSHCQPCPHPAPPASQQTHC